MSSAGFSQRSTACSCDSPWSHTSTGAAPRGLCDERRVYKQATRIACEKIKVEVEWGALVMQDRVKKYEFREAETYLATAV